MLIGKYHCHKCQNAGIVFQPPVNPLLWFLFWMNFYPCPSCAVPHQH